MSSRCSDPAAKHDVAADLAPILTVRGLSRSFGTLQVVRGVSLDIFPGEVLGIVGQSGSGKSTLLRCISGQLMPDEGQVIYRRAEGVEVDIWRQSDAVRRQMQRGEWGYIFQNPRDGLRMDFSAGANAGERIIASGERSYETIRRTAMDWLERLEIDAGRIDDKPDRFSGGMQQRLQLARAFTTSPRLLFMDEPTGGLDVAVQARLLDIILRFVRELGLATVIVTHDLRVARLLTQRLLVMLKGEVIESGLTDQILDDPQHPYSQLLVSAIL